MKININRFINKMESFKQFFEPSDNYIDYPNLTENEHYLFSLIKFTDFYFCSKYPKINPGDIIQNELFVHFTFTYQQYIEFVKRQTELFHFANAKYSGEF